MSGLEERLRALIKRVGQLWNEEPVFLDGYIEEQVAAWKHDLPRAINSFMALEEQACALGLSTMVKEEQKPARDSKEGTCKTCGYRAPACFGAKSGQCFM